ncbi:GNAT family N-acetyltransferase [Plectonema cf. radiosum LEGE 06105]|uniref:GNAT family N-acetyltransferase n=1 Tax=Plectonema cf. radiosum LEGE 06105 TaxID=945769 RepID=A0A8J7F7J4_9CYAN|nr:GNAT family protein [Plectonema radiosum]MBE9213489.1 GNAT family N-acetyltransferase [Plectonema cf. radiosum LEGE 06105]
MENIRLKPTDDNDLNFVLQAEQNQENRSFVNPWTKQQHRESLSNSNIAHFIVERTTDNCPVGYAILADLMNFYQSIELRRIVITDKGKGYGRATLKLIKKLSFEEFSAHRLWLDVKEDNHRAKRLYESEGFTVEGCLRECLNISNTWESLVIMSMLNIEYFNA